MKQLLLSLAFTLFSSIIYAQIGIGTTSPDPSSILDIQSTTKGILAPRINLNNVSNSTIDGTNTNAAGLLIYNTNASVTGGSGVGYYYWDGSTWTAMKATGSGSGSADGWQLDGNNLNGKANDGTTFLGTTTYHSLYFKVDGDQIGRLHPNGGIALGLGASSSVNQAFAIGENASAGNTSNYAFGKGANASGSSAYAIGESSVSSQNKSYAIGTSSTASGTSSYAIGEGSASLATGSYAIGAGANSSATGSFAIGNQSISASNNTLALGNEAQAINNNATALGYQAIASNQNSIAIGPATTSVDNSIILGNTTNTTTDSYAATKVGIGTSNPSAKLHINGTFRYVDGNEGNGKVMTSDANGNATWQDASSGGTGGTGGGSGAYAQAYRNSGAQSLQRYSFTQLNLGTTQASSNVTVANGNLRPGITGLYKVTYSVNVERTSSSNGGVLEFYLGRNTNKIAGTSSYITLSSNSDVGTVTKTHLISFDANQNHQIELYAAATNTATNYQVIEGTSLMIELLD